ncbi:type II toxin-antitoxin system VapC family toxin [Leptolyngbya sp. NIES-2104]|uniref:type II toxin-antitoxin system VapC family toxin n=1 Tax=Leptolyngbya sp. NIES-2104 TaxID=1552121 RepID=UPI0006ECA259|nr:PIN domain-containing protein [Leptolyngbya sp. NIES-2104]GAP96122.1 PIN domain protein [Leptolyngbya sp. NIES-2104]
MRILIDTNVILDLLLEREPFVETAIALFEQIEQGNLEGSISSSYPQGVAATTITNVFYIIRKTEGREVALVAIRQLLIGLQFCTVDRQTVENALSFGLKDFEDSIQLACATLNQLDGIVTCDQKDFMGSNLPIYSPTELLNQL